MGCKRWEEDPDDEAPAFAFVGVGNWWSEYECLHCKERIVVNDDADETPESKHKCKVNWKYNR